MIKTHFCLWLGTFPEGISSVIAILINITPSHCGWALRHPRNTEQARAVLLFMTDGLNETDLCGPCIGIEKIDASARRT